MGAVMALIGDRNPKDVFYEQCKKMNVNPDMVLNLARALHK